MEFKEQVLDLLADVAENDVVKENPDVEIFEEGIIDSFQTVGLLLEIQNRLGIEVSIMDFDRDEWATQTKLLSIRRITMKLKPFLPIIISGILFLAFVLMPASWFTGLVTNKAVANNRISLTDQVLKGTLIQNKLFSSDKYYPIYGSSELNKLDPFNPALALNHRKILNQFF